MTGSRQVSQLNHVSIPAADLAESERFYREVLGCERIQAPDFGFPVCWMRLGDLQLHLQQVGPTSDTLTYQHFAVSVSDFIAAHLALHARGAFEEGTRYADLWLLPSGELQMFARDPSGNLLEIDHPDASQLDFSRFARPPRRLDAEVEQSPAHLRATLFLTRGAPALAPGGKP